MQYKVLALDLDGTLTNTEKVITPRTKAALQEAARRGVCIVLVSGRPTDAGAACLPGRPDRAGLHIQPLLERRAADL